MEEQRMRCAFGLMINQYISSITPSTSPRTCAIIYLLGNSFSFLHSYLRNCTTMLWWQDAKSPRIFFTVSTTETFNAKLIFGPLQNWLKLYCNLETANKVFQWHWRCLTQQPELQSCNIFQVLKTLQMISHMVGHLQLKRKVQKQLLVWKCCSFGWRQATIPPNVCSMATGVARSEAI